MSFYIKVHENNERMLVSVCDTILIGKTLDEKGVYIEVSERFFKGDVKSEKECEEVLDRADSISFLGKESVDFCLKLSLISKESIIKVQGMPYALVFSL